MSTIDPVFVRRADQEVLGRAPNTMRLLADTSTTGGALSANLATLGEGADGAKPHFHEGSSEMFFVLDGALQVLTGGEVVTAEKGDFLLVPPRTSHAFGAAPGATAELLIVFTPGVERFEYFRLLDRVQRGKATPEEVLASQDRFDNHFVDSAVWLAARSG